MAFDIFCCDTGYEEVLPIIKDWMKDENTNVRRAVSEGLRIWTSRPYFREHPEEAIVLLFSNTILVNTAENQLAIRRKAVSLGINDRVFSINSFISKATAENPSLIEYKALSVEKMYFGSNSFFDSFRNAYKEFDRWFVKKCD